MPLKRQATQAGEEEAAQRKGDIPGQGGTEVTIAGQAGGKVIAGLRAPRAGSSIPTVGEVLGQAGVVPAGEEEVRDQAGAVPAMDLEELAQAGAVPTGEIQGQAGAVPMGVVQGQDGAVPTGEVQGQAGAVPVGEVDVKECHLALRTGCQDWISGALRTALLVTVPKRSVCVEVPESSRRSHLCISSFDLNMLTMVVLWDLVLAMSLKSKVLDMIMPVG